MGVAGSILSSGNCVLLRDAKWAIVILTHISLESFCGTKANNADPDPGLHCHCLLK